MIERAGCDVGCVAPRPERSRELVGEVGHDGDILAQERPGGGGIGQTDDLDQLSYSMRRPLMAREITSCWICSVPSKMSKVWISRSPCPDKPVTCGFVRPVRLDPAVSGEY